MTNLTGDSLAPGAEPRGDNKQVKLGRYEVVRELGKGAMGIVYLAKDPLIGRLVALKTIRPAAHADDDETKEFQQRFVREAQAAGILNHPAIVTVHDIGQDESTGVSFIAMEYVEGQNLKEILAQGRPLSFDMIGDIISQVADGLDFAHAKGIVHRDVKPANIILLDGMRAKITDFGIAKIASGGGNLTSTGQFLGTPNYMAPEQIKGAPVDGRTDIFSLGICLYECLTRRKPFGGDSLTSISYKIVHEPFPPIHEINPLIPDGYEEVVAHCLEKDPAKRFQRGRDLANALHAVIRGEKPVRPADPMLNDATIVTRDRMPTVEIPFPEANDAPAAVRPATGPLDTNPQSGSMPAVQPPRPMPPPPQRPGAALRKTLDGVTALPLWRRIIPAPIFFAVIAVLLIALGAAAAAIRSKQVTARPVDVKAERRVATERQLRMDGNQLLHEGKVDDAYGKFEQLSRMAPSSPAITTLMQKLSMIRQQQQLSQQQISQAKAKFDEGRALYDKKQYAEAANAFGESFRLNPNSEEAATYLKLAQEQDTLQLQLKQQRAQQPKQPPVKVAQNQPPVRTTTTAATTSARPIASNPVAPAQLTTFFNSPFTDGYITVKVGSDVVLSQEPLWEEKGRFLTRRKVPRQVGVTREFTAKNADVAVYVTVPSMKINEQHVIARQNFQPGIGRRLIVSYDASNKKFDYQLN